MKSDTMTMLDRISTSIEKAVRTLRPAAATKKRMTLTAFVSYALSQIQKAGREERAPAMRRLEALKRSVDQVAARVAKLNAEDLDSEKITVDVETAFAPSGGQPIEGLTTAADQRSTELAVTSVNAASGNTNFAENLGEVAKALQKLKSDLAGTGHQPAEPNKPAASNKPHTNDRPSRAATDKRTGDPTDAAGPADWPLDLNTTPFRTGVTKADEEPVWGYDPDGLRAAKAT